MILKNETKMYLQNFDESTSQIKNENGPKFSVIFSGRDITFKTHEWDLKDGLESYWDRIDSNDRDVISSLLQEMNDNRKIKVIRTRKIGNQTEKVYGLGEMSLVYFPTDYSLIGQAEGINDVACAAFDHNISFGRFVTIAKQKGNDRVDMLAYDYDSKEVISIEIESKSLEV